MEEEEIEKKVKEFIESLPCGELEWMITNDIQCINDLEKHNKELHEILVDRNKEMKSNKIFHNYALLILPLTPRYGRLGDNSQAFGYKDLESFKLLKEHLK